MFDMNTRSAAGSASFGIVWLPKSRPLWLDADSGTDHHGHMTTVGVARLKAELSRYLAAVKHGEEVLITERGRPVARLVAPRGEDRVGSRRDRLARAGVLMLGAGHVRAVLRRPPKGRPDVGDAVLAALLDERSESR